MSLSNPNENGNPNPSTRWFEWNGQHGVVNYYDKGTKKTISVPLPFTFILLDELATVRGWHDASSSGIYSNEVKDTRQDALIVKAFKGGTLAEGLYRDIKDRVNAVGGSFNTNCYIAFKDGASLGLGALRFKGASLGSWMEFRKQYRKEVYGKAVKIGGFTEGKKGSITYRMPTFALSEISPDTLALAIELDKTLQEFLDGYLSRTKPYLAEIESQSPAPVLHPDAPEPGDDGPSVEAYESAGITDADLPDNMQDDDMVTGDVFPFRILSDCGESRPHGHHENYDKPLDVIWLCPLCHKRRHKEMKKEGIEP